MRPSPIEDSYWVEEGTFLAGRNPLSCWTGTLKKNLQAMLDAGTDTFIDLTLGHEFNEDSYVPVLRRLAGTKKIDYYNHPITDFGIPTREEMSAILNRIHAALNSGRHVYVHCYAGVGRTGTVVGCYLVDRGLSGAEALAEIPRLRSLASLTDMKSPQTREQKDFVVNWEQ